MYTAWMFGFQPKQHARIQKFSQGVEVAGCGGNFVSQGGDKGPRPFFAGFFVLKNIWFFREATPPPYDNPKRSTVKEIPLGGGGSPGSVVNFFSGRPKKRGRGRGEGGLPQVFTCNSYFYCMLLNLSKCNQCNRPMCIIGLSTGWILTRNIINVSTTSNNHA